ncbi:hypothetical protein CCHL11_02795 [Colletotrichum chlorophyti]|uniref:Uncharacterized protein n=1 Tax=Colletotrichum chlorophyti TaxID=708187 RepID=A0A1Q8S0X7_9PEZI|nr:hypothetical protein CCHL11_02795 [Colletotrichum chlorophyti]
MIARNDPVLTAQIINPPTLLSNVARSVEKKKRPIQGLGISKSTTPTERYPNHACTSVSACISRVTRVAVWLTW